MRRAQYFKKADLLLYACLLFVFSLLGRTIRDLPNIQAEEAEIYVDGRLAYVYPLEEKERKFFVDTGIGGVNVEMKDKKIRVTSSYSPLKICVKQGWISQPGDSIIGVPDRLVIQITGQAEDEDIDARVR